MDSTYFKCFTEDCDAKKFTVFYGKSIPEVPTCAVCNNPYTKIEESETAVTLWGMYGQE